MWLPEREFKISLLLLSFLCSSFLLFLLEGTLGLGSREEIEAMVGVTDALDVTSCGELPNQTTCNRSVHLKLFAENTTGDAKDLWGFRKDLVVFLLLKEYFIVCLFGDLNLSPLLASFLGSSSFGSLSTLRCTLSLLCRTLLCLFCLVNKEHSKLINAENWQSQDHSTDWNPCKSVQVFHRMEEQHFKPGQPLVSRLLTNRNLMTTYHLLFLEPDLTFLRFNNNSILRRAFKPPIATKAFAGINLMYLT